MDTKTSMPNVGNDFKRSWEKMVTTVGSTFGHEDKNGTKKDDVTMSFVPAGAQDYSILNSLTLDARVAAALPGVLIEKFDRLIAPSGKIYIVSTALDIYVNNELIGWRLYLE